MTYSCHTVICQFDVRGIGFPVDIYGLTHLQHSGYTFREGS